MVWTIEDCPREDNHPDLGDTVQVYLLLLGGEMPGAQLVVEQGVAGVFCVMFPIDEDDVQAAYIALMRHAGHPRERIYAANIQVARDTGLPRITTPGKSKVLRFFMPEAEEVRLWDIYGIGEVVGELLEWGYGSGEELYDWLTTNGGLVDTQAREVFDGLEQAYTKMMKN